MLIEKKIRLKYNKHCKQKPAKNVTNYMKREETKMSEFMSYDPWANITTRNGFHGDEIVSMLQKSIRKGKEENAIRAAYEMYITSPQFEDKLWRRLMAISVEDIGFGDTEACRYVYTLNQIRKEFLYADGDRSLFFIQAIRYLCRCKKERSSDHIKCRIMTEFEHGKIFEVPDYAYDMHTQKGREMGRDVIHFLEDASVVTPELENEEFKKIKADYVKFCKEEKDKMTGEPKTQPFAYNVWQY